MANPSWSSRRAGVTGGRFARWLPAVLACTVLAACATDDEPGQLEQAIETPLIAAGATWKYLDNGINQGTAWRATSFDDAATTLASVALGGADEQTVVTTSLPATGLVAGLNVIAVEVHQAAVTSSDLGFDLSLRAN